MHTVYKADISQYNYLLPDTDQKRVLSGYPQRAVQNKKSFIMLLFFIVWIYSFGYVLLDFRPFLQSQASTQFALLFRGDLGC